MAILHKNSNPQLSSSSHSSNDVSSDDWVKIRRSRAQRRAVAKAASAASAAKKKEQQIAKDEALNTDSPLPQTPHTQADTQHEGDASLQEQLARSSISKDDSNLTSNDAAAEVPPVTSQTEAQPEHFTAAEQKMVDTINSVRSKIDQIQFGVPTLKGQINNLSAKLCLLRWGQSLNKPIRVDAEKLIASHKSLYYNAGMIDESTLQQIFRLDSIQTDNNEIRKLRKAAVLVGNDLIKLSVSLRQRLERIKKSLDKLVAETATPMQDVVEEEADENSMKVDDAKESESGSESESDVEESDEKKEQQHSKPASPNHAASTAPSSPSRSPSASSPAAATAAAPQSKLEKKYGHLNLPSYSGPQFQASVDRSGALIIESDMSGIDSDDLIVRPEAESRTLSISGVKLPQRTRHIEAPFGGFFGLPMQQTRVAPHGFFTKRIDLSSLDPHNVLDLSKLSAVVDSQNNLFITIPRKQTPPQTQRKVPYTQQYQQMEEEDDEDVDYFSHPFASYSRPQPQRYAAYAPYQRNPFFGARGFW